MKTLVLAFKKIESEDKTQYDTCYSNININSNINL